MTLLPHHLSADGVIDAGPGALLASYGFRRKARNFHRSRGPFVDSVYFQTFRGAPFSFCVDLSLILPFHHEVTRGARLPGSPSSGNASRLASTRVDFPAGDDITQWLVVTHDRPAEVVAGVVMEHLPRALSFFDAFPSVEHVIAALRAGSDLLDNPPDVDTVNLAVLLAYVGNQEEALALLTTLPPSAVPRGLAERLANREEGSPNPDSS